MTSSNIEVVSCRETTPGTANANPRMRKRMITSEALELKPGFERSDRIRDDRMEADPTRTGYSAKGSITNEWSFPPDGSPESEDLCSVFGADWTNTPFRDNDGVADSAITGVTGSTSTVAVVNGSTFPVGALVRLTGFGVAGNNGIRRVATASATAPAFSGAAMTDEAAPPGTARMKVIGIEGATGDLVAVADGITSTVLDFSTFSTWLKPGARVRVGGSASANRYATDATNGYARVRSVAAGKLTLDELPSGWTDDTGTGKAIRIMIGDDLRQGSAIIAQTLQKRFVKQDTPSVFVHLGMVADEFSITFERDPEKGKKIPYTVTFMGLGGSLGTVSLDASPDPESGTPICATGVHVGRLMQSGARVMPANAAMSLKATFKGNVAMRGSIDEEAPIGHRLGDFSVSLEGRAFFGDITDYTAFMAGTPFSYSYPVVLDNQGVFFHFPRLTRTDGETPKATAKNTDVEQRFTSTASYDALTSAHAVLTRFEWLGA